MSKYSKMRSANTRQRTSYKGISARNGYGVQDFHYNDYEVSSHCVKRHIERFRKPGLGPEKAKQEIISMIRNSRLVAINGNEEHRICNGHIFVCKKLYEHGRFYTLVVTEMMTENVQKYYSTNMNNFKSYKERRQQAVASV